jgi:hypothetical protein
MTTKIRFGIVGTGFIANLMVDAIRDFDGSELVAVASRRRESADEFAVKHGSPIAFSKSTAPYGRLHCYFWLSGCFTEEVRTPLGIQLDTAGYLRSNQFISNKTITSL